MRIFGKKKTKTEANAPEATAKATKGKIKDVVTPPVKEAEQKKKGDQPGGKSMKELYGDQATKPIAAAASAKTTTTKTAAKRGSAFRILLKPLVSEKASFLGAENKYIFTVAAKANKIEIAKAIKEVYGIKPVKVNIVKNIGKQVRYGRTSGRRKDWKKAIVTLPTGQTIKVYEGV